MSRKRTEKIQLYTKSKKEKICLNDETNFDLLSLPYEMIEEILRHMSEHDIFWNLGFTCQRFRAIALETVKIIDLCDSHIEVAKEHFNELLKHEDVVKSIRHLWICSDLDDDVREALKQVLQDSSEKYNILVIDYRLFNNFTSRQIGEKFTHLESLLLPKRHRSMKRLTNRSIRNLVSSCKKLEWIDLRDCTEFDYLSNRNVISLIGENCKYLECLLLSRCSFTNQSIKMVFRNCNYLEMVIMNDCDQLTDEPLITLGENCCNLKLLCVDNCTRVSDKSIRVIAENCLAMEEFSLRNTGVTDISIEAIAWNCHELRVLNVRKCNVTAESIKFIPINCGNLENLDITKILGAIPIEYLQSLAFYCHNLKRLHLGFANVRHHKTSTIEQRLFTLSWSIESHLRVENCPHCLPIVKNEAPIIAKEIGISMEKLCLEGFVVTNPKKALNCWFHN